MASIKISTGLKVYDIEDECGNVRGQISFNPADINFFPRAKKISLSINDYIEDIKNAKNDDENDVRDMIKDYDEKIKAELNALFDDDNLSNVVFGNQNCFNVLNGETFIERFLNAFMPIIKQETEKQMNSASARIEEYKKQVSK